MNDIRSTIEQSMIINKIPVKISPVQVAKNVSDLYFEIDSIKKTTKIDNNTINSGRYDVKLFILLKKGILF